ncbi:hypothetical protein ACLB2K_053382 [Fragaria x ananassa]
MEISDDESNFCVFFSFFPNVIAFNHRHGEFEALNTEVLGVSVDSVVIALAGGVDTSANCVCWWCSQVRRSDICLSFSKDKSWITLDKNSDEYREGVKQFVLNSKRYARNPEMIIFPCAIRRNLSPQTDDDLEIHLMRYDVDPDYDIWCAHGEDTGPSIQVVDNESSNHIDVDYELPKVL